jgi:adenylyl cyclase-associated protein
MFNCSHVTVQVTGGKLKSVILDRCEYCSVVFETVISACEIVHCKKIELQTTGVCPSFSIDQTEGCVVYLSKESVTMTNFVTSQSTEMNGKLLCTSRHHASLVFASRLTVSVCPAWCAVSFPDGDEQKELPIPEQFVHKISGGVVTSEVSDVYH